MLHCKRLAYEKHGSRSADEVPPTAGLPSVENGRRSMLGQTRVQRHAVLSISMEADPHTGDWLREDSSSMGAALDT